MGPTASLIATDVMMSGHLDTGTIRFFYPGNSKSGHRTQLAQLAGEAKFQRHENLDQCQIPGQSHHM